MHYTRREFTKLALVGAPAAFLLKPSSLFAAMDAKASSTWAGVEVGLNVPYSFGTRTAMTAEDILARCVQIGISDVELRAQAIENSFGLPAEMVLGPAVSDYAGAMAKAGEIPGVSPMAPRPESAGRGTAGGAMPRTPEEIAAYKAKADELRHWRLKVSMSKATALRAKYAAAGVDIGIVKFDGIADLPDDELDYAFTLAKALGARAVSGELSMPAAKRLGAAADRNQLFVAHHSHLAGSPAIYEEAMSFGKFAGVNLDIGHFVAGNYGSPVPFIQKHHARITHLHVKDRLKNAGPNVQFGEGDTPIKEVLQLIRDNRWPIQAVIEFEIPMLPSLDRNPAIMKCMEYCKNCLLA
jgi:sugar phosphate isomerase/epimerase